MSISIGFETPFIGETARTELPEGLSIFQMAQQLFGLNLSGISACFYAKDGTPFNVPRKNWHLIYPKQGSGFHFFVGPGGGGGSKGKNILAIVAAIAVAVVAPQLVGALLPGLTGIGATVATSIITSAGLYGVSLLFPPSTPSISSLATADDQAKTSFENISVGSNLIQPGAPLPYVAGLRRMNPPLICQPRFYLTEGGLPAVQAIGALAGYHYLADLQIGENSASELNGLTYEIKDGAPDTVATTFIDKVSFQATVDKQALGFKHDEDGELEDQETPTNSEPTFIRATSRYKDNDVEEFYIRLAFSGLLKSDSPTSIVGVPIRIRLRVAGSSAAWYNLPEWHLRGTLSELVFKEIRFKWVNDFGSVISANALRSTFFVSVPAVGGAVTLSDGTTSASGPQWEADSYFKSGSSSRNVSDCLRGLNIFLNEAIFPKAAYEVEILVGGQYVHSDFTTSTYSYDGTVGSFFFGQTTGTPGVDPYEVFLKQAPFTGKVSIQFISTVFDKLPWTRHSTSLIALQAVNLDIPNFSILAGAYVDNYNTSTQEWDTVEVTKSPAAHYRNICLSDLNAARVSETLLDNDDIVDWWEECYLYGYEVNAIISGQSLAEAKNMICSAGFGSPRKSDSYGIFYWRNRQNETPVQGFSYLTCSDMTWSKSLNRIPGGITAKFKNEDNNYSDDEVSIRNPITNDNSEYLEITYDSITNPDHIRSRALLELLQISIQDTSWLLSSRFEHIRSRRGDLVAITVDHISDQRLASYINEFINTTEFSVIQDFSIGSSTGIFSISEFFAQENIFGTGVEYGVQVQTSVGLETRKITNVSGNVVTIDEAFTDSTSVLEGCHVAIGPYDDAVKKCIVTGVRPQSEYRAAVAMVEYKQEIEDRLRNGP